MDTATHFVMGIGLAGLSYIDPIVSSSPSLAAAVLVSVVAGSQAPDLDSVLRMRSNALYVRNHRGISHSIPALCLWSFVITALSAALFQISQIGHLAFWTTLAVCVHVTQDLFNTYGTQAARPFSDKWIAWNVIHIFDPVIFMSHIIAILLWVAGTFPPQQIFPVLYGALVLYYIWRVIAHANLSRKIPLSDPGYQPGDHYYAIPTVKIGEWNIVKKHADQITYTIGYWKKKRLRWGNQFHCVTNPAIEASKNHPDICAFLYFTNFACVECVEQDWGFEIYWYDVRYRHRKQHPFVAVLLMNRHLEPIDSYVGWLSSSRLNKKLRLRPQ